MLEAGCRATAQNSTQKTRRAERNPTTKPHGVPFAGASDGSDETSESHMSLTLFGIFNLGL